MRKSVQKALANQRRQDGAMDGRTKDSKLLRSTDPSKRELRKQKIEEDYGNLPIR